MKRENFTEMTKIRKRTILILFIIIVGFGGIFVYLKSTDFFAIDKCLDSGGRWNYNEKKCEYSKDTLTIEKSPIVENLDEIKKIAQVKEQIDSLESVYDFEFYLKPEVEEWYNNNSKKMNSPVFKIADIFSKPNTDSLAIGYMIAYYDTLILNYRIQIIDIGNKVVKEFTEIGDWGYGIHLNVIAQTEFFIQLPYEYLSSSAWISKELINGHSESYKGELIRIKNGILTCINSGEKVKSETEVYFVKSVANGKLVLRKEIPEDMPCGEDFVKTENIDSLPVYFIKIEELKNESGDFAIELAYPRGC
jgi:hypothetical protein